MQEKSSRLQTQPLADSPIPLTVPDILPMSQESNVGETVPSTNNSERLSQENTPTDYSKEQWRYGKGRAPKARVQWERRVMLCLINWIVVK